MSITNNRVTLYFSPRKDKDLVKEFEEIETGDLSWFVKNLLRDGIKYRKGEYTINKEVAVTHPSIQQTNLSSTAPLERESSLNTNDLLSIEVGKKEVTDSELESKFEEL